MTTGFRARVLVAEDEEFTLNLLREVLEGANFQVEAVKSVAEAIERVASFDPHAVVTDLNFGVAGPSGADLLQFIEKEHPWVGMVVLTSHASPALAIPNGVAIPEGVTYLVKSELGAISDLVGAVEDSISHSATHHARPEMEKDRIVISSTQGEILLLKLASELEELGKVEQMPKLEGKRMKALAHVLFNRGYMTAESSCEGGRLWFVKRK